jgi:ISXO2-like transposase domain
MFGRFPTGGGAVQIERFAHLSCGSGGFKREGIAKMFHVKHLRVPFAVKSFTPNRGKISPLRVQPWRAFPRSQHNGSGYRLLSKDYNHGVVTHSKGEYVVGAIHTNTIESFWSMLKRGIVGSYHKVSKEHLPAYVAEFEFRVQ